MILDSKIPGGSIEEKWTKHKFELKLVNPANKRKFTVIVVGTGLAGSSAAASLAELLRGRWRGACGSKRQWQNRCL